MRYSAFFVVGNANAQDVAAQSAVVSVVEYLLQGFQLQFVDIPALLEPLNIYICKRRLSSSIIFLPSNIIKAASEKRLHATHIKDGYVTVQSPVNMKIAGTIP